MQEWVRRALRTFLQAALGFIAANMMLYVTNMGDFSNFSVVRTSIIGLATSAVAAGIAAVMNMNFTKPGNDDDYLDEQEVDKGENV
ncbi:MAG TPA: hypothetical protein DCY74_05680 [Clostridiales bacterium]|jgi:hypothetical protein|nr:hypothetical protein [Clostridiales bacterium]HCG36392.1 hypothetical protein [Clostridiales bacterium]